MYKRLLAAMLACLLCLSLCAPALAIRVGSYAPRPAASGRSAQTIQPVLPSDGTLSFDQIPDRVRGGNLNALAARAGLDSALALDREAAYESVQEALDQIRGGMLNMGGSGGGILKQALSTISGAFQEAFQDLNFLSLSLKDLCSIPGRVGEAASNAMTAVTSALSGQMSMLTQLGSLGSTIASLEEQQKALEAETYAQTIADTTWMVESTIDQIVAGAESLYLTILTTELQLETMEDALASTGRALAEMDLRYALGQIPYLTLEQVRLGYDELALSLGKLEDGITTMKLSLESLIGAPLTGTTVLTTIPLVTQDELNAISYPQDLAQAKNASYSLHTAAQTLDEADEAWQQAQEDNEADSYQYRMAELTHQSAVYQYEAAVQAFELSFRNLYAAIEPARNALTLAEDKLSYQEQMFAAAQLRHQQGNLSANGLLDAQDALSSARRDTTTARLELFTAYHSYRLAVEKGIILGGNGQNA